MTTKKNFTSFLLFLLSALPTTYFLLPTAYAATNDYVNYWTFDEGGGRSANDLVGGQNGVLVGTSTGFGWASGKVGTALGMDGAAGTGVALPNAFLSGSQGTISLWLKMNDLSDRNIVFSGMSTISNNVYAEFVVDRDGRPTFQFRDTTDGNDHKAQATHLLNKNEWYNVVFTANAQGYHVYINGEEATVAGENVGRWFSDISNQTFIYRIGASDATPMSGSFNGYLDDVKIYNRALNIDEVTVLYNEGNAAKTALPVSIAPKISFTISEDHVPFGGSVMLNWSGTNLDSCTASGGWNEAVTTSGSRVFVKLASDTTYTLSCSNKYGASESSVKVYVSPQGATSTSSVVSSGSIAVTALPPVSSGTGASGNIAPSYVFSHNLQIGSRGNEVGYVQLWLVHYGFLGADALTQGLPTGYFGNLTKAALIKYQKSHNINPTGFFGPLTRAELNKSSAIIAQ